MIVLHCPLCNTRRSVDIDTDPGAEFYCCNRRLTGNDRVRYGPGPVYVDGCAFCDREKELGNTFFPAHFASDRCRSNGYAHCTCDTCF